MRTIRHRLQKDLRLPSRSAANKPMLTEAMKKKWVNFCSVSSDEADIHWLPSVRVAVLVSNKGREMPFNKTTANEIT
ncbi:hypothetical protein O3P69_020089 [Scylla paramamosain]|uniref:Uncharacterized protein n=1 Tax=Scylla paramamosain TaxID=85552 RepID=A0AAW0TMS3_SCYPA